jgi:hypothetical protein
VLSHGFRLLHHRAQRILQPLGGLVQRTEDDRLLDCPTTQGRIPCFAASAPSPPGTHTRSSHASPVRPVPRCEDFARRVATACRLTTVVAPAAAQRVQTYVAGFARSIGQRKRPHAQHLTSNVGMGLAVVKISLDKPKRFAYSLGMEGRDMAERVMAGLAVVGIGGTFAWFGYVAWVIVTSPFVR